MWIRVLVLLDFKSPVLFFEFYGDIDIDIDIPWIVFVILYVATTKFSQAVNKFSFTIDQGNYTNTVSLSDLIVVGTERGSGVHNTGTIFGSNERIVENSERTGSGSNAFYGGGTIGFERQQLLIATLLELRSRKCR